MHLKTSDQDDENKRNDGDGDGDETEICSSLIDFILLFI